MQKLDKKVERYSAKLPAILAGWNLFVPTEQREKRLDEISFSA